MEITNILSLFAVRGIRFKIPAYQRSYSWGETQVNQFIEDLENASSQYYLGHFLFEKTSDKSIMLIIDGQQRLTTCVIFFSCLIEALKNRNDVPIDLDDITDYYLKDLRKGIQKFETVDEDNNYFFNEIIENSHYAGIPATRSQQRIKKAKMLFKQKFAETKTEELLRWYHLIEEARITYFEVDNKIQAAQIFAFQNDRGKPLSNLEIVKSFFMLQIYLFSDGEDLANQNILYIERYFTLIYSKIVRVTIKEDEVLNYFWRSYNYRGFNSEDTVSQIKQTLLKEKDKIKWIKDFMLGLSSAFSTVEKIESSKDGYIMDLRYLNNMALSYPFFMKADRLGVAEKIYNRLAHFLENITFRTLLRGGRADIENRLNYYLTKENDINKGINDMIYAIKNNGWWSYWNDYEMKRIMKGWFYRNRVDNYLLWKYELYICNENHPMPHKVTFEDLIKNESIEHIAPQTPTNGDPIANGYGEYYGDNGISSKGWLNSVGNLMLISRSHNSSIGNKPFVEKIASYGRDNLLNQQKEIVELISDKINPVWDSMAIENRRNKIIKAAMDIWNLDNI